jgi:CRP-like cAMP-binding protein
MAGLRKDAKLALLTDVPLFRNFSKKELMAVARAADEVDYEVGEILARQSTRGDEAFVVVSGSVAVRRNGRKVATLGAGDVAGEMALIDGEERSADLIAAEASHVLVIPRRQFGGLLDDNPHLSQKLLKVLAGRLRNADRSLYG